MAACRLEILAKKYADLSISTSFIDVIVERGIQRNRNRKRAGSKIRNTCKEMRCDSW